MITIGVSAVGSGIGQSVLRSLSFSDLDYRVVGMDVSAYNSGIHWVDRGYVVPPVSEVDHYLQRVLEICKAEGVDVLIPGLDTELPILSGARDLFADFGCLVLASSTRVVALTGDKQATHDWCVGRGLPFVDTRTLTDALAAPDLDYPVIAKPRSGSASAGAQLVASPEQLRSLDLSDDQIVQAYLPPRDRNLVERDTGGSLEQSNEISAQYVIGEDGSILGDFVSINRLKAGIPVEIVPVTDEPWVDDGMAVARAMAEEGARGPLNLQGRLTAEGKVQFFEFNARFTGITGIRGMMGFREVEASIRSLVLRDEAGARDSLSFDPGLVGLRHVGDMVVAADRVAAVNAASDASGSTRVAAPAPRVFVTGANGFVGAATLASLVRTGSASSMEALVRSISSGAELKTIVGDSPLAVVESDLLHGPLELAGVDTVIHLAAARPVGGIEEADLYRVNVEGTRRLLLAARSAGVRRFIYLSTQAVYGTTRPPLWVENFPPQPDTAYGTSKWLGEELCRPQVAGEMEVVVLRAARVFGLAAKMRWDELPHNFARLSAAGEPLEIHGDGSQRMDLLHVRDLADAVAAAVTVELPRASRTILNIGGGHPVSLSELAAFYPAEVRRVTHTGATPPSFGMDIRRARALLGWSPQVSLRDAVDELLAAAADVAPEGPQR